MKLTDLIPLFTYFLVISLVLIALFYLFKWVVVKKLKLQLTNQLINKATRYIVFFIGILLVNSFIINDGTLILENPQLFNFLSKMINILSLTVLYLLISTFIDIIYHIYQQFKVSKKVPIKAVLQAIKVALVIVFGFGMIAIIMNKDPFIVMGSVSTIAAFISFIFKEILLGFFAGIQLTFNRTVELRDYIEIPALKSKGIITEIGLTTVTIQNIDESVSTLPAYSLISNPLINYRHIYEAGYRHLTHKFYIKMDFVKETNNLATFVEKVRQHIATKPKIIQEKPIMIQFGDSEVGGLPLHLYCYVDVIDLQEFTTFKTNLILEIVELAQKQGLLN